ncbi:Uncharacterised protein [Mycobacteroides abscessus subsp. abscessus]|nr:Uncharacterised protein [Mycobacteroides abscessus subsp. abscessus]
MGGHDLGAQGEHAGGGDLEAGDVEDLGADVRVEPVEAEVGGVDDARGGGARLARGHGETELLVLVGGGDEVVGMGFDADGDAQHHRRDDALGRGDGLETVDLVEAVDDDPSHPVVEGVLEFGDGLVVPVQAHARPGDSGGAGDHHLSERARVESQSGLVHPPGHRRAEERLARVEDVGAGKPVLRGECGRVRLAEELCAGDEVVDVEDERRRAEAFGEVGHGVTGDSEDAV